MPWQSSNGGGSGGPWGGGSGGGGGGSGGGGGGGPWGGRGGGGQGPGGGGFGRGGGQPDLEDMIRRSQEKLKQSLPGGMGGKGILIAIAVLAVLWMLSGFFRVNPGEQGVVLRFGEWVNQENLAQPGLHWHLPWPIETAVTPQVDEVRSIAVGFRAGQRDVEEESLMLTRDQNIIDVDFSVQWRISNAGEFLFNIREPQSTIKLAAESAMREVIGQTDIQPALTDAKEEVAFRVRETLQRTLDEYQAGVLITAVNMQDVQPPSEVADAFEDVQRARQDLDRLRNQAEAYRNRIIPEARGEAQRIIQGAEAYRERVINEAEGEAQRFIQVYDAYSLSPEVTRQRLYIETVQKVLQETGKIIVEEGNPVIINSGAGGIVPLQTGQPAQGDTVR